MTNIAHTIDIAYIDNRYWRYWH